MQRQPLRVPDNVLLLAFYGDKKHSGYYSPRIYTAGKVINGSEKDYGPDFCGDTEMPLLLDVYRPTASADLSEKIAGRDLRLWGRLEKRINNNIKCIRDLCDYFATRGYVALSIQ